MDELLGLVQGLIIYVRIRLLISPCDWIVMT